MKLITFRVNDLAIGVFEEQSEYWEILIESVIAPTS